MKPSKFVTVRGKKAWFLPPNFSCLTWKGYAYCKTQAAADKINETDKIDSQLESHETIHIRQAQSTKDSWFRYYLRYGWGTNLSSLFIELITSTGSPSSAAAFAFVSSSAFPVSIS